ncbi:uncharacterized protein UTRI_02454 [Ustilago trichophora]|uniref:Uncharacterized protein n=1 Tax=Ustilago trichophora TaxID=86804 RepID=A0A5C3E6U2_9BASI|nr:uncharacterized protein UTRI_02454 [Ustilago trichophora]
MIFWLHGRWWSNIQLGFPEHGSRDLQTPKKDLHACKLLRETSTSAQHTAAAAFACVSTPPLSSTQHTGFDPVCNRSMSINEQRRWPCLPVASGGLLVLIVSSYGVCSKVRIGQMRLVLKRDQAAYASQLVVETGPEPI